MPYLVDAIKSKNYQFLENPIHNLSVIEKWSKEDAHKFAFQKSRNNYLHKIPSQA